MSLHVEVVADDLWAEQVSTRLVEVAAPDMTLCLATGDTVAPVYEATSDLAGATVLLLDEFGGLDRDDPARCESMMRRHLMSHLLTPSRLEVPGIDDADPTMAAARYRHIVATGIDLAVVGLGANGHIGMNEPGTGVDSITRMVELHPETSLGAARYGAAAPPTWGITVGMAELMDAGELWLLVAGAHKREILDRALNEPVGPALPATYLRRHRNARLIADRSAFGEGQPAGGIVHE